MSYIDTTMSALRPGNPLASTGATLPRLRGAHLRRHLGANHVLSAGIEAGLLVVSLLAVGTLFCDIAAGALTV